MSELEAHLVETLAGGRTRSALEFVTELRVPFDDVKEAIDRLVAEGRLEQAYTEGDETFYALTESGSHKAATI